MTITYTGSCALFGTGSTYVGSWLSINVLVVLIGFSAIAMVYALSRLFPSRLHGRIAGISRVEFTQLAISLLIIGVLLAFSVTACGVTQSMSSKYLTSASAGSQLSGKDPFSYAEYYIGNLSLNTGMKLLTYIYATSIAYTTDAQVLTKLSSDTALLNGGRQFQLLKSAKGVNMLSLEFKFSNVLGTSYATLSSFYIALFSSMISVAIGILFLQWLALPVIEAVAFTVLLPVALIMRAVAYGGGRTGLRRASNTFLAFAIALYIIYPLTVALDTYIVHWIYTPCTGSGIDCNPNYQYLTAALTIHSITPTVFSSATSSSDSVWRVLGLSGTPAINSLLEGMAPISLNALLPFEVPAQAQYLIDTGSQFLFVSIVLFSLNIAITLVFGQSLALALDAGIEGENPLWAAL